MTQRDRISRRDLRAGKEFYAGFTLVEMLIAMAITLVMMAALVTVFANISGSVTRRRATIEMSSALRNVRETLARDLAGATCPAVPWQRPESNVGYLEIIEGPQNDYYPSPWLYSADTTAATVNGTSITVAEPDANGSITESIGNRPGIDLAISSLPGSNLRDASTPDDEEGRGAVIGSNAALPAEGFATDGRGLGDADDILMLTVRNENEPFVGRIPSRTQLTGTVAVTSLGGGGGNEVRFLDWQHETVESPLAEVVWFAVENPTGPNNRSATNAFGEAGYRTIYRRALLILPDLEYSYQYQANSQVARTKPGVVRVLAPQVDRLSVNQALAALIAFQERYDLSVRLEWDELFAAGTGRWLIVANTLGDLTKPENRYEHHGFVPQPNTVALRHYGSVTQQPGRYFPFSVATGGVHGNSQTQNLTFTPDAELGATQAAQFQAVLASQGVTSNASARTVVAFQQTTGGAAGQYLVRPLVSIDGQTDRPGTARAILDEDNQVVHVTSGLAPLGGSRRGDDVMMTDALSFDLRVYDPGAPTYAYYLPGTYSGGNNPTERADQVVGPGDPGWVSAYYQDVNGSQIGDLLPGLSSTTPFQFQRQGGYVDLAYGLSYLSPTATPPQITLANRFSPQAFFDSQLLWSNATTSGLKYSPFFFDGLLRTAVGPEDTAPEVLTRRFATFDTWTTHYESNGVNEDGDLPTGQIRTNVGETPKTDEGVDGLDDPTRYLGTGGVVTRNGPDDPAERETRPPYDTALRGVQVSLRAYERDSRQIREVKVRESFVPE